MLSFRSAALAIQIKPEQVMLLKQWMLHLLSVVVLYAYPSAIITLSHKYVHLPKNSLGVFIYSEPPMLLYSSATTSFSFVNSALRSVISFFRSVVSVCKEITGSPFLLAQFVFASWWITTSLIQSKHRVLLSHDNTGPGFSSVNLPQIQEPVLNGIPSSNVNFSTVKSSIITLPLKVASSLTVIVAVVAVMSTLLAVAFNLLIRHAGGNWRLIDPDVRIVNTAAKDQFLQKMNCFHLNIQSIGYTHIFRERPKTQNTKHMLNRCLNRGEQMLPKIMPSFKHTSFIVRGHKIVAEGCNKYGGATNIHAEGDALATFSKKRSGKGQPKGTRFAKREEKGYCSLPGSRSICLQV